MIIEKIRLKKIIVIIIAFITLMTAVLYWKVTMKQQLILDIKDQEIGNRDVIVNIRLYKSLEYPYDASKTFTLYSDSTQHIQKFDLSDGVFGYDIYINYNQQCFYQIYQDNIYYPFKENVVQKIYFRMVNNDLLFAISASELMSNKHLIVVEPSDFKNLCLNSITPSREDMSKFNVIKTEQDYVTEPLSEEVLLEEVNVPDDELLEMGFTPSDVQKIQNLRKKGN